jgi:hypothetical protein
LEPFRQCAAFSWFELLEDAMRWSYRSATGRRWFAPEPIRSCDALTRVIGAAMFEIILFFAWRDDRRIRSFPPQAAYAMSDVRVAESCLVSLVSLHSKGRICQHAPHILVRTYRKNLVQISIWRLF